MAGWGRLMPGERSTITVKVDTGARKGPIEDTVEVSSNDTIRPKVTLTLQAYIMEDSQ